jgi:hypothetical protein
MSKPNLSHYPMGSDRLGWHRYYVARFNKTGSQQAEWLAMWYLFLYLAFDEQEQT